MNGQYKKGTKDIFFCLFGFTTLGNIDFLCFDLVTLQEIQQAYVATAANQTMFLKYGWQHDVTRWIGKNRDMIITYKQFVYDTSIRLFFNI